MPKLSSMAGPCAHSDYRFLLETIAPSNQDFLELSTDLKEVLACIFHALVLIHVSRLPTRVQVASIQRQETTKGE